MAPTHGTPYLPSLELCLEGKKQILSWKLLYTGLANEDQDFGTRHLTAFLECPESREALQSCLHPAIQPPSNLQAEFDSYTAAINVSHNSNGRYDLQQIKGDASWLSKIGGIDIITALRYTILEWQSRPIAKLKVARQGDEENTSDAVFESQLGRQIRLFQTWLDERQFQFKCLEYIVSSHLENISGTTQKSVEELDLDRQTLESALHRIGAAILEHWKVRQIGDDRAEGWMVPLVSMLRSKIEKIFNGSGSFQQEGPNEAVERSWVHTQAIEGAFLMRMAVSILQTSPNIPTASSVDSWFSFMDEVNFFDHFETPLLGAAEAPSYCLQSLATLTSLALIKIPSTLSTIPELVQLSSVGEKRNIGYIYSIRTIENATRTLLKAAGQGSNVPQPVALVWSILLQEIRSKAEELQYSRDERQSQREMENFTQSRGSDSDSNESFQGRTRPVSERRTSFGSDTSATGTLVESIAESFQKIDGQEDVVQILARSAFTGSGALSTISDLATVFCAHFGAPRQTLSSCVSRVLLLQNLEITLHYIEYGSDLVSTILAILLGGHRHCDGSNTLPSRATSELAVLFLRSSSFRTKVLDQAVSRFPFEIAPFLELCTALLEAPSAEPSSSFILDLLRQLPSYSTLISDVEYELDDDASYVTLTKALLVDWNPNPLQTSGTLTLMASESGKHDGNTKLCPEIESGSLGLALTDSKPVVARFKFPFSGFRYLGRILQYASRAYFGVDKSMIQVILEPVVNVLSLLATLLVKAAEDVSDKAVLAHEVRAILDGFSEGLDNDADIVSIIFNIFECELQEPHSTSPQADPTEVLVACIHFTRALLQVQPSRVWPFLGRSSLLGLDGVESRLLNIIASREVPTGRFAFLTGSVYLFEALVEDVVRHSASRKKTSTAITRFGERPSSNMAAGIKEAMMAKILHTFSRVMIDIFESARNWRASVDDTIPEIFILIGRGLNAVLKNIFDVDDQPNTTDKLTTVLAPSAEYITEVFLFNSHNNMVLDPFTQAMVGCLGLYETALEPVGAQCLTRMVTSMAELVEHLMRINSFLKRDRSHLESQLLGRAHLLISVFASDQAFRLPMTKLSNALIETPSPGQSQSNSLLGHLGQNVSLNFLELLARVDGPLENLELSSSVWRFVSTVVSHQQQWLALLLLSGETAREYLRKTDDAKPATSRVPSFLDVALSKLRHLEVIHPQEAVYILDFLSTAADHWPWVSRKLRNDPGLIKEFTSFIGRINDGRVNNVGAITTTKALRLQMTASITKILAIIVHRGNEMKDSSFAESIVTCLKYYSEEGLLTPSYNISLHANLQRNFSTKFSGCQISHLKRSAVLHSQLGPYFYYDVDFANQAFAYDKAWSRGDGRSFVDEFKRANINLSYVQAQINLFGAWKSLAVEMGLALGEEKAVQEHLISLVKACLDTNDDLNLPEEIFGNFAFSKAELAFVLLQDLLRHSSISSEAQTIVVPAWTLLQSHASDLGVALAGPKAQYDRVLLKILYLSIQVYSASALAKSNTNSGTPRKLGPNMIAVFLDIVGNCVAKGFRSLVTLLHEDPSRVLPADLATITAIFRACLQIPDIDRQTEQLVTYFADDSTTHYATALFSWADRLLVDDDPVYGSLSMAFLLELSTVPCLAECLILGGSLGQLSASNLASRLMKRGGSGPFDHPGRVHLIWSRGILPLAINLLQAIGAPIAADIAAFLNQFKAQLERAVNSLAPKVVRGEAAKPSQKYITFSIASEVHSLAMICGILDAIREAGSGAGLAPGEVAPLSLDRALLRGDLETLLQRRNVLRDEIVAMDAREEAWSRQSPSSSQSLCESLLEEKVVDELRSALSILSKTEE